MLNEKYVILLLLIFVTESHVYGQSKDKYHLFNPTPESLLRGLLTDRPTRSDGPYSVDAGHFQIETDLISHAIDKSTSDEGTETTEVLSFNNINMKVGLTNNSDLQIMIPSYVDERVRAPGARSRKKGVGDVKLRIKYNVFGNDDVSGAALAVIPSVKLPIAGAGFFNEHIEGGISLPVSVPLNEQFSIGFFVAFDRLNRDEREDGQTDYSLGLSMGTRLHHKLTGLVELFSRTSSKADQKTDKTFNIVLVYDVSSKFQIDAGTYLGLTEGAIKRTVFTGLSVLF